jgi:hypothetical protein
MKPVAEWTDDELREWADWQHTPDVWRAIAAEVLRLREAHEAHEAGCCVSEGWCDEATAMRGHLTRRAEKVEAELTATRAEIQTLLNSEDNEILGLREKLDDAENLLARQRPVIDASLHWYTADPDTTEQDEANDGLIAALAAYREGEQP